jgi:hypothetical protein
MGGQRVAGDDAAHAHAADDQRSASLPLLDGPADAAHRHAGVGLDVLVPHIEAEQNDVYSRGEQLVKEPLLMGRIGRVEMVPQRR